MSIAPALQLITQAWASDSGNSSASCGISPCWQMYCLSPQPLTNDEITTYISDGSLYVDHYNNADNTTDICGPYASVTKISANLKEGNDYFDASTLSIPLTVYGGSGNDEIYGGSGADTLQGDGNAYRTDWFKAEGNAGDDFLIANNVRAELHGGGNDALMTVSSIYDDINGNFIAFLGFQHVKHVARQQVNKKWGDNSGHKKSAKPKRVGI